MKLTPRAEAAYENWDHLLREKIEQLEYFLESVNTDLRTTGMRMVDADAFLRNRIEEIKAEVLAKQKPRRFSNLVR